MLGATALTLGLVGALQGPSLVSALEGDGPVGTDPSVGDLIDGPIGGDLAEGILTAKSSVEGSDGKDFVRSAARGRCGWVPFCSPA